MLGLFLLSAGARFAEALSSEQQCPATVDKNIFNSPRLALIQKDARKIRDYVQEKYDWPLFAGYAQHTQNPVLDVFRTSGEKFPAQSLHTNTNLKKNESGSEA